MIIRDTFEKDIDRRIDGVAKADQLGPEVLWIELSEFVVTKEVLGHLTAFFGAVREAQDNPTDPAIAGRTGVWISGFFGSGKSLLLKVLSLAMRNAQVAKDGVTRGAKDFLLEKISDALLKGDVEKAIGDGAETILFNIDSKANVGKGDEAVIDVFARMFAAHRGFCADEPDVAAFEEELFNRGRLEAFKGKFQELVGKPWSEHAAVYDFYADEIRASLKESGYQDEDAVRLVERIKGSAKLSPSNFAKQVKAHLDSKGKGARIMFFIDEVSNFIGQNGKLMLNLQTITEELGVQCQGRAWVVVTAQEDIEAILGNLTVQKANDFSRIQGRFYRKLKLSSSNTDEVLQKRLLAKTAAGAAAAKAVFALHEPVLKNAISFKAAGMTFRSLTDADQFATDYPFLPYQFDLVPKVFSSIRKQGATGQHLSEGERSMLDAFQIAAKAVADQKVGALVPLHRFYRSLEGNLEGAVKRTIDTAANRAINEFDIEVLKTLFLIRFVEEVKGNVDTLVTLSLSHVDEDRPKLKQKVEAALERLERETLIGRNGDDHYFLTDEEQAVDRDIRNFSVALVDDSRQLGHLLFEETLKGRNKLRYSNGKDFSIARMCDGRVIGTATGAELDVRVISPFGPDYAALSDPGRAILASAADKCAIIVLPDNKSFEDEFVKYMQVDAYIKQKNSTDLPSSTKDIFIKKGRENEERRRRILNQLKDIFLSATVYVDGQPINPKLGEPENVLASIAESLVAATFNQLGLLQTLSTNALQAMQTVLRANDIEMIEVKTGNEEALDELKRRVEFLHSQNRQIVVSELVDHFSKRPFGWPEYETTLLLARLVVMGDVQIWVDGAVIAPEDLYDLLSKTGKWKQLVVRKKESVSADDLNAARTLAQALFHTAVPSQPEDAVRHIRTRVGEWQVQMQEAKHYANQASRYPGLDAVREILDLAGFLLRENDSNRFVKLFLEKGEELQAIKDTYDKLSGFYEHQRPAWDKALATYDAVRPNESALRTHKREAADEVATLREILTSPHPFLRVPEASSLAIKIEQANKELIIALREEAESIVEGIQNDLDRSLESIPEADRPPYQKPLLDLRLGLSTEASAGNLEQARARATELYNEAIAKVNRAAEKEGQPTPPQAKPIRTIKPKAKTLESKEEVDTYLEELKGQIMDAIEKGAKVQVQ